MLRNTFAPLLVMSIALCSAPAVWAQNEGREDLDQATELQLKIKSLNDVGRVIELSESALRKGLDENDTAFAKQLLVSSLWQRASQLASLIFDQPRPHQQWPVIRREAMKDLDKLLDHDDQFADAHLLTAQLEALPRGDREKAVKAIDRAVELLQSDKSKLSEALLTRARLREDPDQELADLNLAIEADPTNAEAWQTRAQFHIRRGEVDKAVADFEKLLESDQDNVALLQALAEALTFLEKYDLALQNLEKAIELAPEASSNYILRSRIHENRQDYKAAIADLDQALTIEPGDLLALLSRARLHLHQGNLPEARSDVDRVLEFQPELRDAILLRSLIAANEGRFHEAIPDLLRILRRDPENVELKLQLATFYVLDQRPRKAIATLTEVIEATKESPGEEAQKEWADFRASALRHRGDALLSVGKHAEAIADYEVALKLAPEDDGILNNLAWVLATSPSDELRNGKRSIDLATRACEVTNYEKPHILSTLAASYAETGDFETAIKWSTKAVELGREKLKEQLEQLEQELESYQKGDAWRELQDVKEKPDPPRQVIET